MNFQLLVNIMSRQIAKNSGLWNESNFQGLWGLFRHWHPLCIHYMWLIQGEPITLATVHSVGGKQCHLQILLYKYLFVLVQRAFPNAVSCFPVALFCSPSKSFLSNHCCIFPCRVHLKISLRQFIHCSNYLWTSHLKSILRAQGSPLPLHCPLLSRRSFHISVWRRELSKVNPTLGSFNLN